ncbi:MAG: hypothetical protein ACRDNJ_05275 [Solirubrobacteraceae bacterium]
MLLAALDATDADERLRRFHTTRGALTANRELSILRSAIAWWREQGWIANDATDGISRQKADTTGAPPTMRLDDGEIRRVFALRVPLREQALWHVVHESGATIERTLALNVADVAPGRRRAGDVQWRAGTTQFMSLLLAGRVAGPVFLTDRRATAGTPSVDRCPQTGRGRLSYRRAAEVFTNATRDLDPRGRGWTLRQLQAK